MKYFEKKKTLNFSLPSENCNNGYMCSVAIKCSYKLDKKFMITNSQISLLHSVNDTCTCI